MMKFSLFVSALVCAQFPGAQASELAEDYWKISEEEFQCIVRNISMYLGAEGDLVIIAPSLCDSEDSILETRGFFPTFGGPKVDLIDSGGSPIIFFSKAELGCLSKDGLERNDGEVLVPKEISCE